HLNLLETKNIGIVARFEFGQLMKSGADTIDIKGNNFH
ncbi:MAG: hypothetical protein ACI9D8_000360, partial [Reinekea sp.]